jgi:hypothetical protein
MPLPKEKVQILSAQISVIERLASIIQANYQDGIQPLDDSTRKRGAHHIHAGEDEVSLSSRVPTDAFQFQHC